MDLLGHGDDRPGRARLAFWRSLALPDVTTSVPKPTAIHRGRGWLRVSDPRTPALELAHFERHLALGGVFQGTSRVLVVDLDNDAGKHGDPIPGLPVPLDRDLSARLALAEVLLPAGFTVRSSASYGLHRWALLPEALSLDELAALAAARLRDVCAQHPHLLAALSPELAAKLRNAPPGGVAGFELLPYACPTSRGVVIRAPFGPGSALVLPGGATIPDPGAAIAHVMHHLSENPVRLDELFPSRLIEQLTLPTTSKGRSRPHRSLDLPEDLRAGLSVPRDAALHHVRRLAERCDGRLPRSERLPIATQIRVANLALQHGCPPALRHRLSFPIAYSLRLRGASLAEAQDTLITWIQGPAAATHSHEARRYPRQAIAKARSIANFVYRDSAPKPNRRRAPRLGPRCRSEERVIRDALSHGALAALFIRLVRYARTNGQPYIEEGALRGFLSALPVAALGITTRKRRTLRAQLEASGLLRLYRRAIPRRDASHPLGIQDAQPALWLVLWPHAPQASRTQRARPVSAPPRSVGGVPGGKEAVVACPVGAVGGAERLPSARGRRTPVGDFEAPSTARQLPQGPSTPLGWGGGVGGRTIKDLQRVLPLLSPHPIKPRRRMRRRSRRNRASRAVPYH